MPNIYTVFAHILDKYKEYYFYNPTQITNLQKVKNDGTRIEIRSEIQVLVVPSVPFRSSRYPPSLLTLKKGEDFAEETVASVDNDFLTMFDMEFIQGDINSALHDPYNIVLTMEMARKYFGSEDALGKSIESRGYSLEVTGIVMPVPHNSHI